MPTLTSRFFLGAGAGGTLHRWGAAPTDDGAPVVVRQETARFAPAGVGGEAIFTALIPVITYTAAATVRFTPIVDDVELTSAAVEVVLTQPANGRRTRYRQELGLSIPLVRDNVDRGRFAVRGVWCQVRVEILTAIGLDALGTPGVVLLEGGELEYEVVGVTQPAVASPSYP